MPYASTPSGWISIILGLILIAIMVFAFYQMNKTLGELKLELAQLRNTLEETKRHTEEVKKKLEEV
ncbi:MULTISPECIES: hypothetical protein [Thermococcus]|uniref:Uncharacterized protein n=2 Tax=Thermococcus TaxID=2263 RepID=A0A0Q2MS46_9EURY|nr:MULTISPECIES: hypothetical protein [Thermococcus]ASJ05773.1 hypothetical protein A3L01_04445 [Thermococcus barossii]ASJ13523.1 hypothetical protein A3L14_06390 [Thermococcus thioreducens]KQH82543.1 hypothetical protein AMR53_05850 [Thermococcus thioreducens]NJE76048.1 hypothetical protein [Thermococcus sp. ES12]SEV89085.1 hypothetical protein SAMN05216170_0676 [Thermococcus thioreducens]